MHEYGTQISQPHKHHSNAHHVSKNKARVEAEKCDDIKGLNDKVFILLIFNQKIGQILQVISKVEEDIAVDAWRCFDEKWHENGLD